MDEKVRDYIALLYVQINIYWTFVQSGVMTSTYPRTRGVWELATGEQ